MNLVGTRTAEDTFFTLVVDSLHLGRFLREDVEYGAVPCCWDLGSGAGLPGLPLRMIWQEGDYWMVEAREKRALFLSTVLAKYPLPGTHVFRGRAEAFMAGPPARTADLIVSRAFMPWPGVLDLPMEWSCCFCANASKSLLIGNRPHRTGALPGNIRMRRPAPSGTCMP